MTTYSTPGPLSTKLRNAAGEITVETIDGSETTVTVEPLRRDEASVRAAEEARIDLRERNGGHELTVEVRKSGGIFGRSPEVRIHIRCPHGADIETEAASADLLVTGRIGNLEAAAASGDITCGSIAGRARVKSASGAVTISDIAGDATINSASGDVDVASVRGSLNVATASGGVKIGESSATQVKTASGEVELAAVDEGRVVVRTASGDILVGICRGSRLDVDAASASGDLRSELELSDEPDTDTPGPLVELDAKSASGDLRVVRAPARETSSTPS